MIVNGAVRTPAWPAEVTKGIKVPTVVPCVTNGEENWKQPGSEEETLPAEIYPLERLRVRQAFIPGLIFSWPISVTLCAIGILTPLIVIEPDSPSPARLNSVTVPHKLVGPLE